MRYLHTMVRVTDIEKSLHFYRDLLGLKEVRRHDDKAGRYTLIFLAASEDVTQNAQDGDAVQAARAFAPCLELTYNWDPETYSGGRNFGHLAYAVPDIYETCRKLQEGGVTINRPPRDGRMAFIKSPDGVSIELLQSGAALAPAEPWTSMANTGSW